MRPFALLVAAAPCALLLQALAAWLTGSAGFGKTDLAAAALLAAAAGLPIAVASSERLRQSPKAKRLLLLEAGCGVAILLAELCLWALLSIVSARPAPCPRNFRIETDISAITPGVSGVNVFSTNSDGLRGPEASPDDVFRVVTVGGSTTECFYLDDREEWPALAGAAVSSATGKRVWLGNAGRSGHTTREHLAMMERLPAIATADAVVVLCGINDMSWHLADSWRERETGVEERAFWNPFRAWRPPSDPGLPWFRTTRLFTGLSRLLRQGAAARDPERELIQDAKGEYIVRYRALRAPLPKRDDLPDLGPALADYRAMLGRLAEAARARGASLLLLTQPTIFEEGLDPAREAMLWFGVHERKGFAWSSGALARAMDAFNRETARAAAEEGVPCVRLDGELPRDPVMFYDDCHYTEEGARRVAALVAPALRKVLESRGPRR